MSAMRNKLKSAKTQLETNLVSVNNEPETDIVLQNRQRQIQTLAVQEIGDELAIRTLRECMEQTSDNRARLKSVQLYFELVGALANQKSSGVGIGDQYDRKRFERLTETGLVERIEIILQRVKFAAVAG